MKLRDHYEPVNSALPSELPPITRDEAKRAAQKLLRHFTSKGLVDDVRRCWTALTPPFNTLNRGWRRLIHDVSHKIMLRRGQRKPHSGVHAKVELEVIQYVIEKGWLNGRLSSSPAVTYRPTIADKLAHTELLLARWETKQRRAKTAIRKLQRRARYYQRQL